MIVLDTNVVSELMRRSPDPAVETWAAGYALEDLFFSAVGEAELRYGAAIMPAGQRRETLASDIEAMLQASFENRILPFDSAAARAPCGNCCRSPCRRASGLATRQPDCGDCAFARHGGGDAEHSGFRGHGNRPHQSVGERVSGVAVLLAWGSYGREASRTQSG